MSNKRTGASVRHTPSNCPSRIAIACGFTEEQSKRMIQIRRVLPFSEDIATPYLDARKLWLHLDKPYNRFNAWAENCIKPLMKRSDLFTEISAKTVKVEKGRPRVEYTLSRKIAAHLAMMSNTGKAEQVRNYFLDMEKLALKLAERTPIRVSLIVENDNAATHYLLKHNADKVKKGGAKP